MFWKPKKELVSDRVADIFFLLLWFVSNLETIPFLSFRVARGKVKKKKKMCKQKTIWFSGLKNYLYSICYLW